MFYRQTNQIDFVNHYPSLIQPSLSFQLKMLVHLSFILFLPYISTIDIIQVRVSTDSSNSWIVRNEHEGFIIDCGCYWQHGEILARKWRENFPNDKLPAFIFLTHTHSDNILGLPSLLNELNVTQVPVYVSSMGALSEMNYWLEIWQEINPFESSMLLDKRQAPNQFRYNEHIKVLDHPLTMFDGEKIHIISNFPAAESIHSSMVYIPTVRALFTGDLVSVNSHLFVSPSDAYSD